MATYDYPEPTLTIGLDAPIEVKGTSYQQMDLHEPLLDQVRKAETHLKNDNYAVGQRNYNIWLVSMVSGWPYDAVVQMPLSKANQAADYLARFNLAGREKPEDSSQS